MRFILATLAALATAVNASELPIAIPKPATFARAQDAPGQGTPGIFEQLIDHNKPELGTFKQRYWWYAEHYAGPGAPIVLEAPGESSVNASHINLSNATMTGLVAETNKGAAIRLEHRYYGESIVAANLTAETLQYLTLDNAIKDLIYFANTVKLPFATVNGSAPATKNGKSITHPENSPWVMTGCSYSGAVSAWTHALAPGTFWAHHCSSAVVEAKAEFWEYFAPVKLAMPQNCSADFQRIISHVDRTLGHGSRQQKRNLKSMFTNHTDDSDPDFALFVSDWLGNWQSQQLYTGYSKFFKVCDYIENQFPDSTLKHTPGSRGVGLQRALDGFAKAMNSEWYGDSPGFSGTDGKLWSWMLCNEPYEWWQNWGPGDNTGLAAKAYKRANAVHDTCDGQFPETNGFSYGIKRGKTVDAFNRKTGGWDDVDTQRLLWVNGEYDPWRPATVSWEGRPGGALQSTDEAPVFVIPKAAHCNDYYTNNANTSPEVKAIFDGVVKKMQQWVGEFYTEKGITRPQ